MEVWDGNLVLRRFGTKFYVEESITEGENALFLLINGHREQLGYILDAPLLRTDEKKRRSASQRTRPFRWPATLMFSVGSRGDAVHGLHGKHRIFLFSQITARSRRWQWSTSSSRRDVDRRRSIIVFRGQETREFNAVIPLAHLASPIGALLLKCYLVSPPDVRHCI